MADDEVKTKETISVSKKAVPAKQEPFKDSELIPWTWNIKRGTDKQGENLLTHEDETTIEATNNNTGRVFKGTTKEFNELMRG